MGQITVEKNVGGIEGLCIITPAVHGDARGYFMETYNQQDMDEAGLTMRFVQDNQSSSPKGVLRGLHFQKQYPQGKLVRVVRGNVFDVAVDLRKGSATYGKWFGMELSAWLFGLIRLRGILLQMYGFLSSGRRRRTSLERSGNRYLLATAFKQSALSWNRLRKRLPDGGRYPVKSKRTGSTLEKSIRT